MGIFLGSCAYPSTGSPPSSFADRIFVEGCAWSDPSSPYGVLCCHLGEYVADRLRTALFSSGNVRHPRRRSHCDAPNSLLVSARTADRAVCDPNGSCDLPAVACAACCNQYRVGSNSQPPRRGRHPNMVLAIAHKFCPYRNTRKACEIH